MASKGQKLTFLFFPFMASDHTLPMIDMAKLFAARGANVTILTTPANSGAILPSIDPFNSNADSPIQLHIIPFPSAAAGLPEGFENLSSVSSHIQLSKFFTAVALLRRPFDLVLKQLSPDCVVSDYFLPWTYQVAAENGIPRIVFESSNFFSACAMDSMDRHRVLKNLAPDAEFVVVPGLPHHVKLLKTQLKDPRRSVPSMLVVAGQATEANSKSYGLLVNSFYELEQDYIEHYRKVMGRKAWPVGPVNLFNQGLTIQAGNKGSGECLKWLDGREPGSVAYMCFGSLSDFTKSQLTEMAVGLEFSGHPFVWVARSADDEWIPEGYEARIEGRGFLIRGWAPEQQILNHSAVGGFVTDCGWNSSLEGITAGLPMATWPLYAEQFYNERLLVDVIKIAVAVGSKVCAMKMEDRPVVKGEALEAAVRSVMGEGEEADGRRKRAGRLKELARRAVEEGGSSYDSLESLMQELREKKIQAV